MPLEVTPAMYSRVFEHHHEGVLILEDLIKRFGLEPYVKGDHAAERQTLVNIGRKMPVDFILKRINQANGVNDPINEEA